MMSIWNRPLIIEKMITRYMKRRFQMSDADLVNRSMIQPMSPSPLSAKFTKGNNKMIRMQMFDRESKGVKFRKTSFLGLRI